MPGKLQLGNGSRVAIVGGGPAGCFFALYLLKFARQAAITPSITLYQERPFTACGPTGCKGCAGVLSLSVVRNLQELALKIPASVIQSKIERYAVHSPHLSLSISNPDKEIEIVSVYRGAGPGHGDNKDNPSFDNWLLSETVKQGVAVIPHRVDEINLEGRPWVQAAGERQVYDLVVLAGGVNGHDLIISGLDYHPPRLIPVAVTELAGDIKEVQHSIGNAAHAFLIPHLNILFGSLVPKGQFINASVMGTHGASVSINDFLSDRLVQTTLPAHYKRVCACHPEVPVTAARNYFSDGFVAVGDAAITRLYKDGIGSALMTARQAAFTVVNHGFSTRDFHRYYMPFCRNIEHDNRWGKFLFYIADHTKNSRLFLFTQHRIIGAEQNGMKSRQPFTRIAWGMFTGAYSYKSMMLDMLRPGVFLRFYSTLLREAIGMLTHRKTSTPRSLDIGRKKIVVLGSGFGGISTLRYLVRKLNKNDNVDTVMISRDNYFLFSPLIHEVALGGIEPRHIAYPIRRIHQRDRFTFVQSEVKDINLKKREVTTTAGNFSYDYLVVSLGGVPVKPGIKTKDEPFYTLSTLRDCRLLRDHIIGILERASIEKDPVRRKHQLAFVVSGSGYIGVQIITELHDFVVKNIQRYYRSIPLQDVRMVLVETEATVMPKIDSKLRIFAEKHITRMGIETRVNSHIASYIQGNIKLNNDETIPAETVIWVAGQVAHLLVADLPVAKDSAGCVVVNSFMEIPDFQGVYAVGDCAHFDNPKTGLPIPPRAHTAVRQGKTAAHNILADLRGLGKKRYVYSEGGEFVTLGDSNAMMRIGRLRFYGFPTRILWLTIYTLLLSGTYNRTRVMLDWMLAIIFGRQLTYFDYDREQ